MRAVKLDCFGRHCLDLIRAGPIPNDQMWQISRFRTEENLVNSVALCFADLS